MKLTMKIDPERPGLLGQIRGELGSATAYWAIFQVTVIAFLVVLSLGVITGTLPA